MKKIVLILFYFAIVVSISCSKKSNNEQAHGHSHDQDEADLGVLVDNPTAQDSAVQATIDSLMKLQTIDLASFGLDSSQKKPCSCKSLPMKKDDHPIAQAHIHQAPVPSTDQKKASIGLMVIADKKGTDDHGEKCYIPFIKGYDSLRPCDHVKKHFKFFCIGNTKLPIAYDMKFHDHQGNQGNHAYICN